MYKKILLPTDGSERSRDAIAQGIAFAKWAGASVVGFHAIEPFSVSVFGQPVTSDVLPPNRYAEAMRHIGESLLAEIERAASKAGVAYSGSTVEAESPAMAIVAAAENNGCDLIIMASHGRSGLSGLLLGSQTIKVLSHCKIPVLVCR
jgi:nucleotide-binding universal stress UspA family protein